MFFAREDFYEYFESGTVSCEDTTVRIEIQIQALQIAVDIYVYIT